MKKTLFFLSVATLSLGALTTVKSTSTLTAEAATVTASSKVTLTQTSLVYGAAGGSASTGRILPKGSSWQVSAKQTINNHTWYNLGNNQWVTDDPAYNQNITDHLTAPATMTLWQGFGDSRQDSGRTLPEGSSWTVSAIATADGVTWYEVGNNQWVTYAAQFNPTAGVDQNAAYTVTIRTKGATLYQGYDANKQSLRALADGSSWHVIKQAVDNSGNLWYEVGPNEWVSAQDGIATGVPVPASAQISGVPLISQLPELPNGCEITAVTMMLQYAGANVTKDQLANEMPKSSDPNKGYVGDPFDSTGVTIFPSALMDLVQKYAGNAIDMTGMNLDAIKYQVGVKSHPVVTWMTLHGFPYHAVVVISYNSHSVGYLDCWTDSYVTMSNTEFVNNWNTQARRAISY